ncbi:hypothetical protein BN2537_17173 [Streptomyces venezuelae]|nr:hypothetical protein BN2537_17173 [Streptomyces venezuelae]
MIEHSAAVPLPGERDVTRLHRRSRDRDAPPQAHVPEQQPPITRDGGHGAAAGGDR